MEIESRYYDELQAYINDKKWDYAMQIIKQSGIHSPAWGADNKNVWFHYLAGLAYYFSGRPLGALSHFGAFLNMATTALRWK